MDVLEWFRGVEVVKTDGSSKSAITGGRMIAAILLDPPVVVHNTEEMDWRLDIQPVGTFEKEAAGRLEKVMKTDWGAMPEPDPYREERKQSLRDASWLPHIKHATVLRDSCDESDVRLRHDSATGLDVELPPVPNKHTVPNEYMDNEVLLALRYAACPNASYNSAHYDNPQGCKWCARRKAVLEYLKNSS
jgi:hypothetical protein